jgi:hydrogenase-4 component B
MIKSGIYGLVRVSGFFAAPPAWWGSTILILGVVSGVLGVVFAIAQHDIKRLLAYHSVENIGIIAIGLGAALLGKSYDLPLLTILGLAGALLHVINHGLFKSLLFLGAGAMIHATGTREIEHYGGLLRRLPLTGIAFLGGAVAICGLPPLNGFVSEWLIYLGLFQSLGGETLGPHLSLFAIPALALIGGLALACFVKVFGIAFLGAPRTPAAAQAHEAPTSMLWPMGVLLACCLLIGLWPGALFPLLAAAASLWSGMAAPTTLLAAQAPAAALSWSAFGLLLLLAASAGALRLGLRKAPPRTATWGCGYPLPTARMQYTASSFGALLVDLFRWGLRPDQHGGKARGLLPAATEFSCHTPDTILDRGVIPVCRGAIRVFSRLRALIQNGSTSFYLLYVALALFGLLTLATLSRG